MVWVSTFGSSGALLRFRFGKLTGDLFSWKQKDFNANQAGFASAFAEHFTLWSRCRRTSYDSKRGTRVVSQLNKGNMPEKETLERARRDAQQGKAPSTQAGEFIREEMHHIRQGKHGARSTKQAIAIGLSKARRAGVKLPPPRRGQASAKTRKSAASAYRKGQLGVKTSRRRSQAWLKAMRREGHGAASHRALSRQARSVARRRGGANRRAAARKAARTRSQERWS
jgi:hypothetical protein